MESLTVHAELDFYFDSTIKPQNTNAFVLLKKYSNAYVVHWFLQSDSNSWSKTLEAGVATSGNHLMYMRISESVLSGTFFNNTYGDIGFKTFVGSSPEQGKGTLEHWKDQLGGTGNFTLAAFVSASDSSLNLTTLTESAISEINIPTLTSINSTSETLSVSEGDQLLPGTAYRYQTRFLVADGANELYSNWSTSTLFTTLIDSDFSFSLPELTNVKHNTPVNSEFVISNNGPDSGVNVKVIIEMPFDVLAPGNFSSANFNASIDGSNCPLTVQNPVSRFTCNIDDFSVSSSKTMVVNWMFPIAEDEQIYTIKYWACNQIDCADNSAYSEFTVEVEGENVGEVEAEGSGSGGGSFAWHWLFVILLLRVFMKMKFTQFRKII